MDSSLKQVRAEKKQRGRALKKTLERVTRYLIDQGALKIVLFGSFAGVENLRRTRRGADLDILCVMPPFLSGRKWMARIYAETDRDVDCDILAFTEDELERALPVSGFVRRALETGRILYEKRPEG